MVRRVILLACAGILVFSMSACGKSQEAAKHQIEGSHVVSAESSMSAQEPEELSEAEPELPQDDKEITLLTIQTFLLFFLTSRTLS